MFLEIPPCLAISNILILYLVYNISIKNIINMHLKNVSKRISEQRVFSYLCKAISQMQNVYKNCIIDSLVFSAAM